MARTKVGVIGFVRGKPISSETERKQAELADRMADRDPLNLCGVYRSVRPYARCFGSPGEEGETEAAKPPPAPPEAQFRRKKSKSDIPLLPAGTVVIVGPGLTEGQFVGREEASGEIVCVLGHRSLYEDWERLD